MSGGRSKHVVAIIQARMGSTRLPGKVMRLFHGLPLLGHMLLRVARAESLSQVVVATSELPEDDSIAEFCDQGGVAVFRGSPEDVLERFYFCAHEQVAEVIVRLTADCPLIDSRLIDQIVGYYLQHEEEFDYVSNTLDRGFPRGMDVEVFSLNALNTMQEEVRDPFEREHVTLHLVRHPDRFRLGRFCYRLTVDTEQDARVVDRLLGELKPSSGLSEIVELLGKHPEWALENSHVLQRTS